MAPQPADDLIEESVVDEFVEEEIDDEDVIQDQENQSHNTFSVHDAEENESKDKVMSMKQPVHQPGNSTVNMASVVPDARVVSP